MNWNLSNLRARCFLFLVVLSVAGCLSYLAGKAWLAQRWSESDQPEKWRAATRLEPGNAQYWERLGLYCQWNVEQRNLPEAARYLQRATQINPRAAGLWLELAVVEETLEDSFRARQAYEIARSDYPMSAIAAWRYGSFLLRHGDLPQGFAALRQALENDPSLEAGAISECWSTDRDAEEIADLLLPQKSDYYVRAIRYFLSQSQIRAALLMWSRLANLNQLVPMKDATDLIDALIDQNRIADAERVWEQALQLSGRSHGKSGDGSLIFNAGFEHDFTNGGFGWRELPLAEASYDFDDSTAHSGRRSLRITFDGTANLNFQNVYQYVAAEPNREYQFTAYVRTEGISTDSGIGFEIVDPRHPAEVQILTPNLLGTNSWTRVQADFLSGPHTQLLEILLRRAPSEKLDDKLRGIVWVDDVSLVPIEKETRRTTR